MRSSYTIWIRNNRKMCAMSRRFHSRLKTVLYPNTRKNLFDADFLDYFNCTIFHSFTTLLFRLIYCEISLYNLVKVKRLTWYTDGVKIKAYISWDWWRDRCSYSNLSSNAMFYTWINTRWNLEDITAVWHPIFLVSNQTVLIARWNTDGKRVLLS